MLISNATRTNWKRLTPDTSEKLRRGANKTRSAKKVYPREYIVSSLTYPFLERFLAVCGKENVSAASAVYSLAVKMLESAGILNAGHVQSTLRPYAFPVNPSIYSLPVPAGERDVLGVAYQCLLSEGEKNLSGSYYTPFPIVSAMLENVKLQDGDFLDPCCGSGAFLLSASATNPERLWGCDADPVAAMIAKVNLLCKYAHCVFIPRIFCCDYLAGPASRDHGNELFQKKFAVIATNPPWGAKSGGGNQGGRDSFSCFFTRAHAQLDDGGRIVFLFPEAVLNIRAHRKIRETLLTESRLDSIRCFAEKFTGVMTEYVAIAAEKKSPAQTFRIERNGAVLKKSVKDVLSRKDMVISLADDADDRLLRLIDAAKKYDLSASTFALGIVTGDNRGKISRVRSCGMEPIYTGREVDNFVLKKAQNYVVYDRSKFQQAAKDRYYRAPEKLVYRFISRQMVFAYDDSRSLFLNSANILIPSIPGYGVKTVLAFLNSELLRYYYLTSFRDVKILKSNLCRLPFPEITPDVRNAIERIVDHILQGDRSEEEPLQKIIFSCYRLNGRQISHVRMRLRGTTAQRSKSSKNVL